MQSLQSYLLYGLAALLNALFVIGLFSLVADGTWSCKIWDSKVAFFISEWTLHNSRNFSWLVPYLPFRVFCCLACPCFIMECVQLYVHLRESTYLLIILHASTLCPLKTWFQPILVDPKLVINYLQSLKNSEESLKEQVSVKCFFSRSHQKSSSFCSWCVLIYS